MKKIIIASLCGMFFLCLCAWGCNKKQPTEPAIVTVTASMTATAFFSATPSVTETCTPAATFTATMTVTVTATNTPAIMMFGLVEGTKAERQAKLILTYDSVVYDGAIVTLDDIEDGAPAQQLTWNSAYYYIPGPVTVYNYGHILRMTVYSKGVTYTASVEAVGDSTLTWDYYSLTATFNHPGMPDHSSIQIFKKSFPQFNYNVPPGEVCNSPVVVPTWTYEPDGDYLLECEQGAGIYATAFGEGVDGTFICKDKESLEFTKP